MSDLPYCCDPALREVPYQLGVIEAKRAQYVRKIGVFTLSRAGGDMLRVKPAAPHLQQSAAARLHQFAANRLLLFVIRGAPSS